MFIKFANVLCHKWPIPLKIQTEYIIDLILVTQYNKAHGVRSVILTLTAYRKTLDQSGSRTYYTCARLSAWCCLIAIVT